MFSKWTRGGKTLPQHESLHSEHTCCNLGKDAITDLGSFQALLHLERGPGYHRVSPPIIIQGNMGRASTWSLYACAWGSGIHRRLRMIYQDRFWLLFFR